MVNMPVGATIKTKAEAPGLFGAGIAEVGCADASLYQWLREAGLTQLICFPQLTAVAPDDPRVPMFQRQALAALSGEEANISDRFQTKCCIWSFED
jgi:hypothetical protein